MNSLLPENSYTHTCQCGTDFLAPKGTLHCHKCLYDRIAELEETVKSLTDGVTHFHKSNGDMKDVYKLPSGKATIEDADNIGSINYSPTYIVPMGRKDLDAALVESLRELYKLTKRIQELEKEKSDLSNKIYLRNCKLISAPI